MNSLLARQLPTLIIVTAAAAAILFIAGSHYWLDNSVLIAIFALFALAAGMSYGYAGILSLATGAFAALGAYATAILTTHYMISPYLGLLVAVALPMLVAYPLALIVIRLSPLPLSIATLVLGSIVEIAIREGDEFTGGYVGISGIPSIPIAPSGESMHILAWGCVAVALYLYCNMADSAFGRAVETARHDPLRATADGVNVPSTLALFFAVTAGIAGVGGWLYAHYLSYLGPESINTTTSIQVLLMAVVGGSATRIGPIIGAGLLLMLSNYLPAAETQGMVFGAALVLVLLVAPDGLIGSASRLVKSLQRRRQPAQRRTAVAVASNGRSE